MSNQPMNTSGAGIQLRLIEDESEIETMSSREQNMNTDRKTPSRPWSALPRVQRQLASCQGVLARVRTEADYVSETSLSDLGKALSAFLRQYGLPEPVRGTVQGRYASSGGTTTSRSRGGRTSRTSSRNAERIRRK